MKMYEKTLTFRKRGRVDGYYSSNITHNTQRTELELNVSNNCIKTTSNHIYETAWELVMGLLMPVSFACVFLESERVSSCSLCPLLQLGSSILNRFCA